MRFPPTLWGFPMTVGLWYVLIIVAAILVLLFVLRIFKNMIKDFASGVIFFLLILVFGFIFVNLISGQNALESGFSGWFNNIFR
ncbi:MAG: hypothetical protein CL609_00995 [Anaerolineaceae bacterium]|nr:hypothetical protein [Anaerolineaceae bacterium]